MPVRDGAPTLPRALASLASQTLQDWELIAVDDHSSDATARILADAAAADARIHSRPNPGHGLVDALNAGLAACRAPWIARLDADDEALPDRLALQVAAAESIGTSCLITSLVEFGGSPAAAGYARHVDWLNSLVSPVQIALARFIESPVAHPSVLFSSSLPATHGTYRHGPFPEDYDLWLRWLGAGIPFTKVPVPLLRWHDPPTRLSRTDPRYHPDTFFSLKAPHIAAWIQANVHPARSLWIWGAGRITRRRAARLEAAGLTITGWIDIDPRKTAPLPDGSPRTLAGRPILPPDQLPPIPSSFILPFVSNPGARPLIHSHLQATGRSSPADFLPCA